MSEHSPLSPEARASKARSEGTSEDRWFHRLSVPEQLTEVGKRVGVGVYSEGFIHAGNFAYLSLLAVFSFFIAAAAIIGIFGDTTVGKQLVEAFFATVPPSVGKALREPVESAMTARSGPLLWLSAFVGLWTTTSLVETIRDVLHRSYGTEPRHSFVRYRLGSILTVIGAVLLAMAAFSAQVIIQAVEEILYQILPFAENLSGYFAWGQIIPFIVLFLAIYVIFRGLTPYKYRAKYFPKWPGAALVSLWWLGCTSLLPYFISNLANYDLTYGSLAGVMVTLIFFYLIGLGLVTGAQLNAALANRNGNDDGEPESEEE